MTLRLQLPRISLRSCVLLHKLSTVTNLHLEVQSFASNALIRYGGPGGQQETQLVFFVTLRDGNRFVTQDVIP